MLRPYGSKEVVLPEKGDMNTQLSCGQYQAMIARSFPCWRYCVTNSATQWPIIWSKLKACVWLFRLGTLRESTSLYLLTRQWVEKQLTASCVILCFPIFTLSMFVSYLRSVNWRWPVLVVHWRRINCFRGWIGAKWWPRCNQLQQNTQTYHLGYLTLLLYLEE